MEYETSKQARDERNDGLDGDYSPDQASGLSYRVIPQYPQPSDQTAKETQALMYALRAARTTATSLPERVFGGQIEREKTGLRNLESLTKERGRLLDNAVREIDEHLHEVKNWLSFARRPYSTRAPQEVARFEKMLHDLEGERRDAYLGFWKDLADLRKEMIESAAEYRATRERSSLLGDEAVYDE